MKKIMLIIPALLLAGFMQTRVQAQSGGNSVGSGGQTNSSQSTNAKKANTSQTLGNGVPFNKDKEQRQSRSGIQSGTPPNSKKTMGSGTQPSGQGSTKQGTKAGAKTGGSSAGNGNSQ